MPEDLVQLLDHVIAKQAVTTKGGPMGTKGGFGSAPPINLDALVLKLELAHALGPRALELEAQAWELIERPAKVPLGLCACGTPVHCEFDRVSAACRSCGAWINRADSVAAAANYVQNAWLSPVEIERETRGWGTPVRAGRVRTWKWRGWITADEYGRYRLADVLALIDHEAARAA